MTRKLIWFFLGAFCLYLAYFIFMYSDIVFSGMSFAKRDILRYYYPMWKYSAESWQSGSIPFWNPYHSLGKPFAGNIQNCVFYPLQIILHLPDYTQAFNVYIFVHLAMAGAFTAVWMRDLGTSKLGSLVAGFAFALSGFMVSAINLTISLCSVAYFPLVLLCYRHALTEKGLGWRVGLAVALLFQYLAGDPSIIFSTLVVLTTITAYRTIELSFQSRRLDGTVILRFGMSIAAFLGLAAFHYPLFYELLKQSTRSTLDYGMATMWSVQFNDLIGLILPFFSDVSSFFMDYWVRQSWLENYYAGISVMLLAVWAYVVRRDRIAGLHVLLFLFGLSLALGRFSGVYWFFNKFFPFFGLIRYPVRFFYVSYFALACLAGLAIDHMIRTTSPKSQKSLAGPACVIASGFALLWMSILFAEPLMREACVWTSRWLATLHRGNWSVELIQDMTGPVVENARRTLLLALAVYTGLIIYRIGKVRGTVLALFMASVLTADLSLANNYEFRVEGRYLSEAGAHIRMIQKDPGLFRIFAAPTIRDVQKRPFDRESISSIQKTLMESLTPNLLLPLRIFDIMGYDSLFLENSDYLTSARVYVKNPERSRFNNVLNAKYFVSLKKDIGPPIEKLNESDGIVLYRDPQVLDRAFLVRRAVVEPDRKIIVDHILSDEFKPLDTLYLQSQPAWTGPDEAEGEGEVVIEHYTPNEVRMRVDSPGRRWLFFSDAWYSAWKVRVDGVPVPIERANVAFRAIPVGPGTHEVVWKYDTLLFKIGLGVSLLTAVGLLLAMRLRRRGH